MLMIVLVNYMYMDVLDEDAFNFNENANTNDGSCIKKLFGCLNVQHLIIILQQIQMINLVLH